jgi:phage tail sheath gpL-like
VGLPVTAVADAAVVTVTARHKGEAGNYLDLRHSYYTGEALPKGLTLAVVAMSGGTANPDLADALASLAGRRFHRVVSPYTDAANLTAIEEWITERSGPLVKLRGRVYTAYPGTIAEMSTQGNTRNCARVTCVGSGLIPSPPEIMAAVWGAVAAYYINIDCARPLQTLALPGILPPPPADIPDISERNILLYDGISTFTVDDGGVVRIERSITTYQTNALGVEDPAYLDDNTVSTLDEIIDQTEIRITNRYPRHKLADDNANVGAGQAVARPKDVRAELIALFRELENNGIVEGLDQFMNDLVVERDATDKNRLNALIPPDLVGQFRVFAGVIQFIL